MNNDKKYINKSKFKTAVAACLVTVIFGTIVGYGSSQLVIGIMQLVDGNSSVSQLRRNPNNPNRNFLVSDITTLGTTDEELSGVELFERLSDTVVGIKLVNKGSSEPTDIIGSGVITSFDGFIITCAHVIENADKVIVVVDDYDDPAVSHEYEAEVLGEDKPTDLAVLKITRDEVFKYAKIGRSSDLKVGQYVAAIGNPVGMYKTMTKGIISGLQRDLKENAYMLPSIQTDAALNPGNSGCPLFDMYGNVVGIVNIKLVSGSNIDNLGFAISIDEAQQVISELVAHGLVSSRPMLGIEAQEISAYNRAIYGVEHGLIVIKVREGSPAAAAGLSRDDVIIKIDGQDVKVISDIQNITKEKSVGDIVTVTVVRHDRIGRSEEIEIKFALVGQE